MIHAKLARHRKSLRHRIHANDRGGPHQSRTGRGTEANGPKGKDRDGVTKSDRATLRARKARRHDVRAHQDLLVGQPFRYW